jgi:FkbM family methyltransferase
MVERDADLVTPTVLEDGVWAPDTTALMRRLLRPGMTFVDAGANIGYFSVLASTLVGPSGRVLSVEADPANVAILRANLSRNGCTNATVFPVAAWSERTKLNLRTNPEGGAGSSVGMDDPGSAGLEAFRIDQLVEGRVDFLKVDCESTDHMVIRGASDLFDRNPRLIATVEFNPDHVSHTGHSPSEILGFYRELGLLPYELTYWGRLKPTSFERLTSSGDAGGGVIYYFALTRKRPGRLVAGYYLAERLFPRRAFERLLKAGGDLLEHVSARIRPRIRRRDRVDR